MIKEVSYKQEVRMRQKALKRNHREIDQVRGYPAPRIKVKQTNKMPRMKKVFRLK